MRQATQRDGRMNRGGMVVREELRRRGLAEADLEELAKGDRRKVAIAVHRIERKHPNRPSGRAALAA